MKLSVSVLRIVTFVAFGCAFVQAGGNRITNGTFSFSVKKDLSASVTSTVYGQENNLCIAKALFHLKTAKGDVLFPEDKVTIRTVGQLLTVSAKDSEGKIEVTASIVADKKFSHTLSVKLEIANISNQEIALTQVAQALFELNAVNFGADSAYKFETFQGGSYISRPDWVFALTKDYNRGNFMGNNNPDYGGGIPVVDFWAKKHGIALASLSLKPEQISLPVVVTSAGNVETSITDDRLNTIAPGQHFKAIPFAIIVHNGDFYNALHEYSLMMQSRGFKIRKSVPAANETEWCAWGYMRDFVPDQLFKTLPKAKALNFKWATLDDGWQDADGDWGLSKEKFPHGSVEFKAIVDSIHANKLKARLWWVPLTAGDSAYNTKVYPNRMNEYAMKVQSKLAQDHPDWFILDKNGSRYQVEWWNTYVLCPAVPGVLEYYKEFLTKAIKEWGFDGVKIDGQNLNAAPPCYNPTHHHKTPYESCYAIPDFFKMVYKTIYGLNPNAVIQLCPCGSNFSLYNIPWTTQFVASDPASSWQVRHRAKTFRALVGSLIPFAGDHVELTNHGWDPVAQKAMSLPGKEEDFASTVGLGGVIASKFTMPGVRQIDSTVMLTPSKEAHFKKWMDVYDKEGLSTGEYCNLYDIAFDLPETHLIKKGKVLYYSLFSDSSFNGKVELRGLGKHTYDIIDYVNNRKVGEASNKSAFINVEFTNNLMLKAVTKEKE